MSIITPCSQTFHTRNGKIHTKQLNFFVVGWGSGVEKKMRSISTLLPLFLCLLRLHVVLGTGCDGGDRCSGHGTCRKLQSRHVTTHRCDCLDGWSGSDCSLRMLPTPCNMYHNLLPTYFPKPVSNTPITPQHNPCSSHFPLSNPFLTTYSPLPPSL